MRHPGGRRGSLPRGPRLDGLSISDTLREYLGLVLEHSLGAERTATGSTELRVAATVLALGLPAPATARRLNRVNSETVHRSLWVRWAGAPSCATSKRCETGASRLAMKTGFRPKSSAGLGVLNDQEGELSVVPSTG